jgi:hypothetical protein
MKFELSLREEKMVESFWEQSALERICPIWDEMTNSENYVIGSSFFYSVAFSPQANYTDRAAAACRRKIGSSYFELFYYCLSD